MSQAYDYSQDPYYLGTQEENLQEQERDLSENLAMLRERLSITRAPEWPAFEATIKERVNVVKGGLTVARDWESVCRLQGEKRAYDWVLAYREAHEVAMAATMEALQDIQARLEERT